MEAIARGLLIIFIIFFISSNCFINLFTSIIFVPLPLAIRAFREVLSSPGVDLSLGVMERIIASTPLKASSGTSTSFTAFPIPGIMPIKSLTLPIFLI